LSEDEYNVKIKLIYEGDKKELSLNKVIEKYSTFNEKNLTADDFDCCSSLLIDIGHCLCSCCLYCCSLLAVSCMRNSLLIFSECFMKNCPYLAFLNSHLCCFHPASIMCLDLFPRRASFLSTDSFFGSLYFYCLCMMLGFSCCLYLYILLSLYLIG
jgi:hypothetical protein